METLPESQSYYAIDALSARQKHIAELAVSMAAGRAKVEKNLAHDKELARDHYMSLQKDLAKLTEEVRECRLYLAEVGEDKLSAYAGSLAAQLGAFNLMTPDYGQFSGVMTAFADKLPSKQTTDASMIARCMNMVRMGHYPTDLENAGHIMKAVAFPEGVVTNLLDPCCGEGAALKKLAVGNNCYTYGIELDESRAEAAQKELHRVGFGSFFHSRVSHEVFHLVLLNPPYLSVLTEGGGRARHEKRFLVETLPHLMHGGLLIYIVPYYRLTPDICRILCDNLSDISIHRFTDNEFAKYSQVAVMGLRIRRADGSAYAMELAEQACAAINLPCTTQIAECRYPLPGKPKKVDIFKGAVFNEAELARQLKASKSLGRLFDNKSLSGGTRRPPLPFTFSQLGLIGGSGLINGLIECECPHIIKGRIIKEVLTESFDERNGKGELLSTEIKEKTVNKMVFNVLTPDGFKALA